MATSGTSVASKTQPGCVWACMYVLLAVETLVRRVVLRKAALCTQSMCPFPENMIIIAAPRSIAQPLDTAAALSIRCEASVVSVRPLVRQQTVSTPVRLLANQQLLTFLATRAAPLSSRTQYRAAVLMHCRPSKQELFTVARRILALPVASWLTWHCKVRVRLFSNVREMTNHTTSRFPQAAASL